MYPLSTLSTFLVYGLLPRPDDQKFDTQRVFAALAILKFFTSPMLMVLQFWTIFISGLACIERIQKFLQRADFEETRELGIASSNGTDGKNRALNGHPYSYTPRSATDTTISIRNGAFGYGSQTPTLEDLTLDLERGKLTMIVGR